MFNLIKPGTAGRREMEVEAAALPWFEPALDVSALMSAVIIKDKMDIQVLGLLSPVGSETFPSRILNAANITSLQRRAYIRGAAQGKDP
jgi:hypothetical protein